MVTTGSIEIDRPIDEVFHLTTMHVPEWSSVVVEEEVLEPTPNHLGTKFRVVTEDRGQRMMFVGVVTEYDPPYANAVQMTGDAFNIDVWYTFESVSGRTMVTQTSEVTGKGMFKILMLLVGWMMKSASVTALDHELQRLKRFCENYEGEIRPLL